MKNRVKELRTEKRMSQEVLAGKCIVSQQTISKIESGLADPKTSVLIALANEFDVSIDYLLGYSEVRRIQKPHNELQKRINSYAGMLDVYDKMDDSFREGVEGIAKILMELQLNSKK